MPESSGVAKQCRVQGAPRLLAGSGAEPQLLTAQPQCLMDIHCRTIGPESASPVLFLHGFMGCGDDWSAIARSLPDHHCLLPDLPGHGRTSFPDEHDLDAIAKDLLMLAPEDAKVRLVGYSMGGRIAFTMLRLFPERIAGAFIISASPGIEDETVRAARVASDEQLARRLEQEPFEDFLTFWYDLQLFSGLKRRPEQFAAMLNRRRNNDSVQLARALRQYSQGRMTPCWQALQNLQIPLHFEAGSEDSKYAALAERIPNADIHICPDCSHTLPVEDPLGLVERLRNWLRLH